VPNKTKGQVYLKSRSFYLRILHVIGCVMFLCAPAFCEDLPPVKVSVGYSVLRDDTVGRKNSSGWLASVSGDLNRWFGLTGEVGDNVAPRSVFGTDTHLGVSSFFGGPHVTTNIGRHASPFAHLLVGAVRTTSKTNGFSASDVDYAIQPGVGMDWWLKPNIGIRVGGDYRRIPTQEFTGSSGFRFQIGIVVDIS